MDNGARLVLALYIYLRGLPSVIKGPFNPWNYPPLLVCVYMLISTICFACVKYLNSKASPPPSHHTTHVSARVAFEHPINELREQNLLFCNVACIRIYPAYIRGRRRRRLPTMCVPASCSSIYRRRRTATHINTYNKSIVAHHHVHLYDQRNIRNIYIEKSKSFTRKRIE